MLYRECIKYKQFPEDAFQSISFSGKGGWTHATADSNGKFEVPTEGTVKFVFNVDNAIEQALKGLDPDDFGGVIDKYRMVTKICPPFNKVIPMFACWKELDGKPMDQSVFLQAMSKDFCLSPAHIEQMVMSSPMMRCETIDRLFPCVTGGEFSESIVMMLLSRYTSL